MWRFSLVLARVVVVCVVCLCVRVRARVCVACVRERVCVLAPRRGTRVSMCFLEAEGMSALHAF